VTVVVDPKSHIYLDGTVIDFDDSLASRSFRFNNPNATGCCGCGKSFCA